MFSLKGNSSSENLVSGDKIYLPYSQKNILQRNNTTSTPEPPNIGILLYEEPIGGALAAVDGHPWECRWGDGVCWSPRGL